MASCSRHAVTSALRGTTKALTSRRQQSLEQQFQSLRLGARRLSTEPSSSAITAAPELDVDDLEKFRLAKHARPVPVSPSYFSRTPRFNDRYLAIERLSRSCSHLPVIPAADVVHVGWKSLPDLRRAFGEPVKATDYAKCLKLIKRLQLIHPNAQPKELGQALEEFKRDIQALRNVANPIPIDKFGRALGVGKRKSSSARAFVLEGQGEVLINGKTLAEYFGRVHDRESAVWALHATERLDKYNVWARVDGGGTTGQAEALTLAIAKGLIAHEPALKSALRKAGCITRDRRTVERKKAGFQKARKGQTWVKR
ncbi:ribosomal protein S5 domain 2-type protein [Chaetomium sp. MPI-SDFR-AT-0129]|nr:ribosomal protein S5 domain 2-type protein [Chaetomium sp. MPI-SDFR-AT-0129]